MKPLPIHAELGATSADAAFDLLRTTFSDAVRQWDFFVNWDKVFRNTAEVEVHLNLWNYLLGKDDFENEFRSLVSSYPDIVLALPSMIVRNGAHDRVFDVLTDPDAGPSGIVRFDFSKPAVTPELVEQALRFVIGTGLIRIFRDNGVKNLVDFMLGVEAGIDSNGRKNRSGSAMEHILEQVVADIVRSRPGARYIAQANEARILAEFGIDVRTGDARRIYDFAIWSGTALILVEVNVFGGGGSKLKSVAGEFADLQLRLRDVACEFVWITDGLGWRTSMKALQGAFATIDHVLNLHLVGRGALREVVELAR